MILSAKKPLIRFLLIIFGFYICWYILYQSWIRPEQKLDLFIIDISISISKFILEFFGFQVFTGTERIIGVDGTGGLWIGDNCNGLHLFIIFAGFIIAYPGSILKKLWYIPAGIILIQVLNIVRIVALAILDTYSRAWTEFNHTYTFNIILYGFIFFLWMFWAEKISPPPSPEISNES